MSDFKGRIMRAVRLDAGVYEEVEQDREAMGQAMLVVILASLAAGVGLITQIGISGLIMGTITALVGWVIWAYLTYFIGTRFLPEANTKADMGEMMRTIGFASAPGLIRILGIVPIPGLASLIFFIASVWMLAAMVTAVKQALDYESTARAIGVCFIGWFIQTIIVAIFLYLFGMPTPTS